VCPKGHAQGASSESKASSESNLRSSAAVGVDFQQFLSKLLNEGILRRAHACQCSGLLQGPRDKRTLVEKLRAEQEKTPTRHNRCARMRQRPTEPGGRLA